jgi:benzoyl-CoA reductase/2-hydroxyglutaryl-CoA dehydratase subunit BcrC/BadD/HgdB
VRKLKEHLEQRFHTNITDEKLREAARLMNRERGLRRQLAALMMRDPPPLTGRQLIEFKSIISGIEADLRQYERAIQFFSAPGTVGALSEPEGRARHFRLRNATAGQAVRADLGNREDGAQGIARPTTGSPSASPAKPERKVRVLLTGVPIVHGAERVLELIEDAGAVVVGMENCTGLKPILDDVDLDEPDPLCAIARKYYHLPCSVMTLNTRRFEILRSLAAKFRPHCVIELVWQACLTYDIESFHVRKLAEEEFHLPYLKITTDYSPSDSARITARVEALLETVRARPHNR